jgi:hypothetical protein
MTIRHNRDASGAPEYGAMVAPSSSEEKATAMTTRRRQRAGPLWPGRHIRCAARVLRQRIIALISFVISRPAGAWTKRCSPAGNLPLDPATTSVPVAPVAPAIAHSFAGPQGAVQAAEHARVALSFISDESSRAHCRALRAVAAAVLALGETAAGLALLEAAINTAVMVQDPVEEAAALAEFGLHALRRGHAARAEVRLRAALGLVPPEETAQLRATLHHNLALALHMQRKDSEEAEQHATSALGLRWDRESRLAREDRALIGLICARRAAARNSSSPLPISHRRGGHAGQAGTTNTLLDRKV